MFLKYFLFDREKCYNWKREFRKTTDVISICLPQMFRFPMLKKKKTKKIHGLKKDNEEQTF